MEPLIAALLRPEAYDHPVAAVQLLETHISWVLLTGTYAYKIKKPVNLGFVDFSTVERRAALCQEELRLNRRLAPDLYCDVRPIHGPPHCASFHGDGPVIEMAVRMHQFRQEELLPAVLEAGLPPEALVLLFEELATRLAHFHGAAGVAGAAPPGEAAERVREPAIANLEALERCLGPDPRLASLRAWTEQEAVRLAPLFEQRLDDGRVREGHGDLHLGNMVLRHGRIEVFDCLEFSLRLRWIDVISDLAFLVMDLQQRGQPELGGRVLDRWLEVSGDYGALAAWPWYRAYRALVRAKVAVLRLAQPEVSSAEQSALQHDLAAYLELALASIEPPRPTLVLMHGVSGSGKSHLAARLAQRLGWLHIRSDVERKRLFGLWGGDAQARFSGDLYRQEVSEHLFAVVLPQIAQAALTGGLSLLLDATFLQRRERQRFHGLAVRLGVRFVLLDCRCPLELAERRILQRQAIGADPSDADFAVLQRQLASREPLAQEERASVLAIAMGSDEQGPLEQEAWNARVEQLVIALG